MQGDPIQGIDPTGMWSLGGTLAVAAISAGLILAFNPNIANAPASNDLTFEDASGDLVMAGMFDAGGGILFRFVGQLAMPIIRTASAMVIARMTYTLSRSAIGHVVYGSLDALGRATGIRALITKDMLNAGQKAAQEIIPPGYVGQAAGHAKGHLLARMLGGAGDLPENFVTLLHNELNNSAMKSFEYAVRKAVRQGETVALVVRPLYHQDELIPYAVQMVAKGNKGFLKSEILVNQLVP